MASMNNKRKRVDEQHMGSEIMKKRKLNSNKEVICFKMFFLICVDFFFSHTNCYTDEKPRGVGLVLPKLTVKFKNINL